jgi:hypothetical protein
VLIPSNHTTVGRDGKEDRNLWRGDLLATNQ